MAVRQACGGLTRRTAANHRGGGLWVTPEAGSWLPQSKTARAYTDVSRMGVPVSISSLLCPTDNTLQSACLALVLMRLCWSVDFMKRPVGTGCCPNRLTGL